MYSILIVTTKLKTEMARPTDRPSDMHVIVMYVYKCSFMCEGRSGEKIKTHLSESEEGGGAREARALF